MADVLLGSPLEPTKASSAIDSKKFKRDFVDTIDKSLILLATYLWGEALKSLFDPSKGVFKTMGRLGPWIVAVVATCIVALRNMEKP